MKSFADWTQEIHDLINPSKPMVDTCNLQDYEEGTFKPALTFDLAAGSDSSGEFFYTRHGKVVTLHCEVKLQK